MDQLANRLAITDMTNSSHASESGVVKGGQVMEQLDKAATLIVHHQPRQRSFAGAGCFLTEIIAHIWSCAQFETDIYGSDLSMRLPLVLASLTLPQHKGKHHV